MIDDLDYDRVIVQAEVLRMQCFSPRNAVLLIRRGILQLASAAVGISARSPFRLP